MKSEVTKEQIHSFLNGYNPMERIVKIEGDYNDDKMSVIYRDENGLKKVSHEDGTTIVLTSHNLKEVEDVCDDMGILTSGKLSLEKEIQSSINNNISKLQIAFNDLPSEELIRQQFKEIHINEIIELKIIGRVVTIVYRGNIDHGIEAIKPLNPAIIDELPLSLEESFIYEREKYNN